MTALPRTADTGLTIVPAGAGAGKTHRIKTTLADWVKRKLVRPDRILAVTFTEAAASELRERIRAGLLAEGLVSEALAVERAYVSTIHGLGLRLLTEHALAAGASPQPRHLGDAERDLLIRQALAQAKALDPVKADPERFGYVNDFGRGITAEDGLRGRVLAMIDLLRGLGDTGQDPGLIQPALDRLDDIYGDVLADPEAARQTLVKAVADMLAKFPDGVAESVTAATARTELEKNLSWFRNVQNDPECLNRDWSLWQRLRSLRQSKRGSALPDGYDDLASTIMQAADVLPTHPGPLADAKLHLSCLIACAQEVMTAYEAKKRALGLIDYADMIAGAERLLRTQPGVRDAVLGEIDCVIIDEFQDTNPVQFALLWQLGARADRTLLVGDVKQSIMGFQGADPRLSAALADAHPESTGPLGQNWRSTPAVMNFVNAMGAGLFGKGYNPLTPTRGHTSAVSLEVLSITQGRRSQKFSKPPEHVAERIARILKDKEAITDRHSGITRPVRPSDVALLVCRHTTAARYAEELRLRGVPVRISEDGWSTGEVVQAARAALSYAANPSDIHAGLLLRTLGPDPLTLQDALTQQLDDRLPDDAVLMRLAGLSDRLASLPISIGLDLVLDAAKLRPWAESRAEAGQARADLLRLEAEAREFDGAHRDLKAAAGFHGGTVKVFLGWLDSRTGERDADRHPDPSGDSAEAVEIMTWHGSKGREWPITVVAEFDHGIEEWPGTTQARFAALDRIDDMNAVLASAQLVHIPNLAAPEAQRRFIGDRRADFEANARNLLYVALTRARDRLIIEWPDFLKDRSEDAPEATCLFHVFADACSPAFGSSALTLGKTSCPATVHQMPEQAALTELDTIVFAEHMRFGAATPLEPVATTPWRRQPSKTSTSAAPDSHTHQLGESWPVTLNTAGRGTALHLAMATCLTRPDLVDRLPDATGLPADTIAPIIARAAALRLWLSDQGYDDLICEVPVLGHTPDGAEVPGTIDLLARGSEGCLLVDHKSGGSGAGIGPYWGQLMAYADLVATHFPDHPLRGVAIHWMDHGTVEAVDMTAIVSPDEL
ncbi:ATP-dependent exoDNAse (exonuclease V) beta subunit (contains helicase and exonuclease domains) [Loktanella salsilacus]|uniref:DNA 3'-5' helicase n=1 Tax=Loktanella salsilacus TaxID=195913 RepID=A0A1I4HQ47_9RHOB|nr:UvrD-helicase domain-containing protein [Loktanella salsilacus]SFL43897.1 ATP-dependent exoDNAse (exonuclease V) beta subunit (contains helicase and exonuclease domains) [Loktanella salsilacus]